MSSTQKKINEILDQFDGRMFNMVEGPNGSEIQFWMVNGATVLVQNFGDGVGFDIYCSSKTNSIPGTVEFVKQQVGLAS